MSNNSDLVCSLDRDTVLSGVRNLPSLSAVVVDLLQSMDNENADTRQLAEKLSRDQALSAKVLRLANSSFYGLRGKVVSIGDAIVVLGLHGVRSLAIAAAVAGVFSEKTGASGCISGLGVFWRHSIAVALFAKALAHQRKLNDGNAFVAGLLHDIGRLALACCFPGHLAAVEKDRIVTGDSWLTAERRVLGFDHAEVGALLADYWCFPALLTQTIGLHHVPESCNEPLVGVVHLADFLGHRLVDQLVEADAPALASALETMGLSEEALQTLHEAVAGQYESACDAFVT